MISLLTSGILTILILNLSWFFLLQYQGRFNKAPAESASKKELAEKTIYWRISGIPEDCDKDKLIDFLWKHDNSLKVDPSDLSLFPGCYSQKQVGVLRTKGIPESFQGIKPEGDYVSISGLSTGGVTIDRNFYNFTPLNKPEGGNSIVDVVAVTGLAGHAFGSWRNRESGKMWLQDILPKDIKNIRVLTYGYNSNLIGNTVDDTLQDQRSNLLIQLLNVRNTAEAKKRPIIFIGYSFGGTLILQTLLEAKTRKIYEHILESTRALFFFGVPHQGFRTSELEAMVKDLKKDGDSSDAVLKILEKLRRNSEFLITQRNDLVDIWDRLNLYSFYEKTKTPTVTKTALGRYESKGKEEEMVERNSSRLFMPREIAVGVSKNHREITKFISDGDPTYITFRRNMREEVANAVQFFEAIYPPGERIRDLNEDECLKTLGASDYQTTRDQLLRKRNFNTCNWLLNDRRYRGWLKKELTILWIDGGPGWGKSVLSSFLSERLVTDPVASGGQNFLVAYFFCDGNDERLRTASAILRHIIDQILRQEPTFFKHIIPEYLLHKEKTSWTFGQLWRILRNIVLDNGARPLLFLIDALDECEMGAQKELLCKLNDLFIELRCLKKKLKIVITSRPQVQFEFSSTILTNISLGMNDTNLDIVTFVNSRLRKLSNRKKFGKILEAEIRVNITKSAEGIFLWVSLILEHLEDLKSTTPKSIREELKKFPKTLPGIYEKILGGIPQEFRRAALKILQWVVFAKRPLSLGELTIAIAVQHHHTSLVSMAEDMETNLSDTLSFIFGPLLRIDTEHGTVHLIHQSAKDFLTDSQLMKKCHHDLLISPAESNLQIATTFQMYLSLDGFEEINDRVWSQDFLRNIHLLDYIIYWSNHVNETKAENSGLWESFSRLASKGGMSNFFDMHYYIRYGSRLDNGSLHENQRRTLPLLNICAAMGFEFYLRRLLDEGAEMSISEGDFGDLLYAGVWSGRDSIVQLLLERKVNVSLPTFKRSLMRRTTPWTTAQLILNHTGLETIIQEGADLLPERVSRSRFRISDYDYVFRDLFYTVINNSYHPKELTVLLLDNVGGDIRITEIAMLVAVKGRKSLTKEITELLLDRGGEVTEVVMLEAVGNRECGKEITELLLDRGGEVTEAVIVAAAGNQECGKEITKLLLNRGIVEVTAEVITEDDVYLADQGID